MAASKDYNDQPQHEAEGNPGSAVDPATEGPRARVLTLVFTDLVDSVALKHRLGDAAAGEIISRHYSQLRALAFETGGREIVSTGDGFFLTFETPSGAADFSLKLQSVHHERSELPRVRIGIHLGEVTERTLSGDAYRKTEIEGLAVDVASRVQSLALAGQILMSYPVFDNIRQRLDPKGYGRPLCWRAHGRYVFKGFDWGLDIYEIGLEGISPLEPPTASEKAHRDVPHEDEHMLGWRPAQGLEVPTRHNWFLTEKLGEGGFGDVWLAEHSKTREHRVLKFCFSPDRLRSLKREVTLFRMLKEALGDRDDIARILDYRFDEAPYFLEMEYGGRGNLGEWLQQQGGVLKVPLAQRLELVAQVADAVDAAHGVGILHKDLKPSNVLVTKGSDSSPRIRVIDFGTGAVTSHDILGKHDITMTGLTESVIASEKSSASGTRLYMAPELIEGKQVTTRSDTYALGVILYQLVCGDLRRAVAAGWERDVDDPLLREDIAACVDGNPAKRLASAHELADRLRHLDERREERQEQLQRRVAAELAHRRRRFYMFSALLASVVAVFLAALGFQQANRASAEEQLRRDAESARSEAIELAKDAQAARKEAEQAAYYSAIGLAEASLHQGRVRKVREVLTKETSPAYRGLEWGWIYAQTCPETFALNSVNAFDAMFSPDGLTFCTGDRDNSSSGAGCLTTYDTRTGKRISGAQIHDRMIWSVAYSPDGKYIATASIDHTGAIVDAETLKVVTRLKGHKEILRSIAFSPDGKLVATAARDATIKIWDPQSGAELRSFDAAGERFTWLLFGPEGGTIVTSSLEGRVRVWGVKTGTELAAYPTHPDSVMSLAWVPGRSELITACKDGVLRIFPYAPDSSTSGAQPLRQVVTAGTFPNAVCANKNWNYMAAAFDDGTARVFDLDTGSQVARVQSDEPTWKIAAAPDGKRILLTSRWSVRMLEPERLIVRSEIEAGNPIPLPQGFERVRAAGVIWTNDRTWNLDNAWRNATGRTLVSAGPVRIAVDSYFAAISPDDRVRISVHDKSLTCTITDVQTGREIHHFTGQATNATFSSTGKLAAISSTSATVTLFSANPWAPLRTLTSESKEVLALEFSPDEKYLSAGYTDGYVVVWNCETGAVVQRVFGGTSGVLCIAFSNDQALMATGHSDDRARVWDFSTGNLVSTLSGHVRYVHSVRFSPDGKRVLTVARDGKAKLWDPLTGRELVTVFDIPAPGQINTALFCRDGYHIAALMADGTMLLTEYFPWTNKTTNATVQEIDDELEEWKRGKRIYKPQQNGSPQGLTAPL